MPATEGAAAEQLRLPPFFPAMPAQCKAEAETLFSALTAASVYTAESVRPNVQRPAASRCAAPPPPPAGLLSSFFYNPIV